MMTCEKKYALQPWFQKLGTMMLIHLSLDGQVFAADGEQYWKQYRAYSGENPNFVAKTMSTKFEMTGDEAPLIGHYQTVRTTDLQGKVQWVLMQKNREYEASYKMAPMDLSLAARIAENPINPFEAPDSVEQLGREVIEQTSWAILRFRSTLRDGRIPILAKVWLHPETGRPRKLEAEVERPPMPGMKRLSFMIDYGPGESAVALPRKINLHYEISLFFKSGVVDFSQELNGWEQR